MALARGGGRKGARRARLPYCRARVVPRRADRRHARVRASQWAAAHSPGLRGRARRVQNPNRRRP